MIIINSISVKKYKCNNKGKMMNIVSLILTTYNNIENLITTLESIESQTYSEIEIIIKDGESTDGTLDVIKSYENKSKYSVRWVSCPDAGIYDAMNQGYALSTGNIIAFFNDTFVRNDAVQKIVDLIEKTVDCVGAHADLVYVADEKIIRYWKMGQQKSIYTGWMPGHPTLFLKREIYEKYGLYKTDYKIEGFFEYVVPPLEGFWWQENIHGVNYADKDSFNWISVIRLPDFVNQKDFEWAVETAAKKKKIDCSSAEFLTIDEGLCVQIMHLGAFDDEPATVALMDAYLEQNGYVNDMNMERLHHEIYLSDARKVAPEKWKTVIRHPIKKL